MRVPIAPRLPVRFAGMLVIAMCVATFGIAVRPEAAGAAPLCGPGTDPIVCVLPASSNVGLANPLTVDIAIDGGVDVGAFQFTLSYNPAQLSLGSINIGPYLSSTGRSPTCIPSTATPGEVGLTCATLGPAPPPGASGSGVLAQVSFTTVGGGTSPLALSGVLLTNPSAVATVPATQDGSVTVDAATPTPCPGVCPTATPTNSPTPAPTPANAATAAISPASQTVNVGEPLGITIDIADVADLAAFEFRLLITDSRLSFVSVTAGAFLSSTGRSVFCPAPVVSSSVVTFGCVSQGSAAGATGSGTLATLNFVGASPGPGDFSFISMQLGSPLGANIPVTTTGATFGVIAGPTPTPTTCPGPCPTPTETPTPVATPTPVSFPTACGTPATVCIQPLSQLSSGGGSIVAGVVADGMVDLGAYQVEVTFDPSILQFDSIANGTFLGSTGRQVVCATPNITATSVRLACSTLGPAPPNGPSGSGVLAVLGFTALADGVSPLTLSNVLITDPAANQFAVTTVDGSVTVSLATATPCPGPCPTPTHTSTPTATPTPAPISCPNIAPTVVCVSPASQTVLTSNQFTVDIIVDNVTNLGAYEIEVQYDPTRITFVSVVNSPFLASTGRTVFCPPTSTTLTSIIFSCASLGLTPPGPDGSGILATVTFQANALTGISPLTLVQAELTDPLANIIPAASVSGSVEVQ